MKKKSPSSVELLLSSRLLYMGYALFLFSFGFFIYALDAPPSSPPPANFIPEEELSAFADLSPHDTFNFFAVSALFAVVGISCILTSYKKTRSHKKKRNK
jgi:hypothetical protein